MAPSTGFGRGRRARRTHKRATLAPLSGDVQEIERDPSAFIQGDDLAVDNGAGREPFAGLSDVRELLGEKVFSPRPEGDAFPISPSKTAVAVEFNFVQPFLSLGKFLNRERIHGLDESDFGCWQGLKLSFITVAITPE